MDAHLFRKFCAAVEPLLNGARMEKIQEFAPDHLLLTFFGAGQKRNLYFRFGRNSPFCFIGEERMAAMPKPAAAIMRLRKYFASHRIAAVVPQVWSRRIWLMAAGASATGKTVWLCLDLVSGPSLHFLDSCDIPEREEAEWPARGSLAEALENWRDWPVLTPGLRKNLQALPAEEQAALLADLEEGTGDIFLYQNTACVVERISAWPLPPGSGEETIFNEVLPAFRKAGHDLVLARLYEQKNQKALAPGKRRAKQILKLLEKLKQEHLRLERMAAREADGLALSANLWKLDSSAKTDRLELDGRVIALESRFSIQENMERIFHDSRRGKRGLAMLEERRKSLQTELEELEAGQFSPAARPQKEGARPQVAIRNVPEHTQAFMSSDGYVILRGRDARGNQALRRQAAGHDIWVHVEQGTGAHVIIRRPYAGHELPERTLIEAGTLAANKSWLSEAASGNVMYAEARHVKPCRSGPPGKVTIDRIRETKIVPVDHSLEEKLTPR